MFGPWKLAAIDDGAADAVAMAGQILGERVHHDVGTMIDGAHQIRRGHGVVDNQWNTMRMSDLGQGRDIRHVAKRIANGFAVNRLGLFIDELAKAGWIARIGKPDLNALLGKGVRKQVVRPAIQGAGRDNIVARLCDGLDCVGNRRHAGCNRQGSNATLKRGNPFFQHIGGRIHDPRVDVASHFQVKQVGAMLCAVK